MSWGNQHCEHYGDCPYGATPSACNTECQHATNRQSDAEITKGPPTVRVGKHGWTWPNKSMLDRQRHEKNEKKRLLKKRRKRDKRAGRK